MKNFVWTCLLFAALVWGCQEKGASKDDAAAYNNAIVSHTDTVLKTFNAFNEAVDARDSAKAYQRIEMAIVSAQRAIKSIQTLPLLDQDSTLRDATLDLIRFYERSFKQSFQANLAVMLADTLEEEDVLRIDTLVTNFANVEDSLRVVMFAAQAKFSQKYGLIMQ